MAGSVDLPATFERRTAWRTDYTLPAPDELIGAPVSPEVEGARLLLWAIFNPMLLSDRPMCSATSSSNRTTPSRI